MPTRAELYDAIEESHDYRADAEAIHASIQARVAEAGTLLDIACGTGRHLVELAKHYEVEGIDIDVEYLEAAKLRVPDATLHEGDMSDFDLGRKFDAVICMGSAIGYVKTHAGLLQAVSTMARHCAPDGAVIVEPFVSRERWPQQGRGGIQLRNDGQIAWASLTSREGDLASIQMAFLAIGAGGIEHTEERHLLGLFSDKEYEEAFRAAGFEQVEHDEQGLHRTPPRGLYIARR